MEQLPTTVPDTVSIRQGTIVLYYQTLGKYHIILKVSLTTLFHLESHLI